MTTEEFTQEPAVSDAPAIEAPEAEVEPQWAKELREQNAQLLEATRTAQGQARRAEQIAAQAIAAQGRTVVVPDRVDETERLLSKITDAEDDAGGILKKIVRRQEHTIQKLSSELAQVTGHFHRQQITAEEQRQRDYNTAELLQYAEDAGVDPEVVKAAIPNLPTDGMWAAGKEFIRKHKKATPQGDAAAEHAAAQRERGNYQETRRNPGVRPSTKVEVEDAYGRGDMTTAEYTAWKKAHPDY